MKAARHVLKGDEQRRAAVGARRGGGGRTQASACIVTQIPLELYNPPLTGIRYFSTGTQGTCGCAKEDHTVMSAAHTSCVKVHEHKPVVVGVTVAR